MMAKPKKPPSITKKLNGHTLYAEQGVTGWYFAGDFPQIAEQYDGCHDASPALDLFEQLAAKPAAGGQEGEAA